MQNKSPSSPSLGTKGSTLRGTTRIRAGQGAHSLSGNGGENRPALTGRSRANQGTRTEAAYSR